MTIILYSTTDEREKAHKILTTLDTVQGTARDKDQIGMEKTEFLLNTDDMSLIQNMNYMYVQELDRYYFVGERRNRVNGLWLVEGEVDPLTSLISQLENCEGVLKRNEKEIDYYVQDPHDVCYQNPHVVYKKFPNGFDGDKSSVILITT